MHLQTAAIEKYCEEDFHMKANFGLGIATGTEGLMYPIPYSSARDVVDLSVCAEKLGFHSVGCNDRIITLN